MISYEKFNNCEDKHKFILLIILLIIIYISNICEIFHYKLKFKETKLTRISLVSFKTYHFYC